MVDRLKDKVVLVTGSTLGIGKAVATLFLAEGATVVLNSHRDDADAAAVMDALAGEVAAGRALYLRADICRRGEVEAMVAAILARYGCIDALVNNAGINVFTDPLAMTGEDWARCFAVDLEGAWNVIRAALPSNARTRLRQSRQHRLGPRYESTRLTIRPPRQADIGIT
jgi:NAD(P)-dependent dehydrogenase (short-subunit alcohol dehydrogenase family)